MSNTHESGGFWNKFKSSTKSLSSSLSQLSLKSEHDGDTPTSTLVHKALVKYYTKQEPFQGYPDWLGHKEELPNEEKVLRKQKGHVHDPRGAGAVRATSSTEHQTKIAPESAPVKKTAGMSFQRIYTSSTSVSQNSQETSFQQRTVNWGQSKTTQAGTQQCQQVSSSMLMRERLKRNNQKSSFDF